ncbi:MAG: hypothetical protein OXG18_10540, partial [Gemmatimonadetes bacterium]|nr:hypothetical protein [Gemmatimonadota bacterium]
MAQLRGPLGVTVRLLAVAAATWVCAAPLAAQSDSASGGNLAERSRLARSLAAEGRTGMALEVVDELAVRAPRLADWTALAVADTLATQGDTRAVRRATSLIGDLRIQRRARRLEADAWAHAGESARALEAVLE